MGASTTRIRYAPNNLQRGFNEHSYSLPSWRLPCIVPPRTRARSGYSVLSRYFARDHRDRLSDEIEVNRRLTVSLSCRLDIREPGEEPSTGQFLSHDPTL